MTWRLQVSSFDDDVAAGRALNKQLSQLARQYGDAHRHVVLEVRSGTNRRWCSLPACSA